MSYTYIKSLSTDFPSGLSHAQLRAELIVAGAATCTAINQDGDAIIFYFSEDPTSITGTVDTAIAAHVPEPNGFSSLNFVTIVTGDSPYQIVNKSVKCNTTGGNITVTLPKAARVRNGIFAAQKINASNTVTINAKAGNLINGASSASLTTNKSYLLISSDGSNWTSVTGRIDTSANSNLPLSTNVADILVDDGEVQSPLHVGANNTVLTADSSQSLGVKWDIPCINCTEVSATGSTSTTSSSYVQMNSMTCTPASGNYLVIFSGVGKVSATSLVVYYAIFANDTMIAHSEKLYQSAASTTGALYTQAKVTVNGSQVIEIKYKTSSGTFTAYNRSMEIIRCV